MGRPRLHATEDLLDAARVLAAEHGPGGVTMAAVAQAAGAPSGSLYHRFPARAELLGEVWLRTITAFQAGFLEALGAEPAIDACAGAARHVVRYSRENPEDVAILLRGPGEFGAQDWPAALRERIDARQQEIEAALRRTARRLPRGGRGALERVVLATVDLPYAVLRRHLRSGAGVPRGAEALVEHGARAILA